MITYKYSSKLKFMLIALLGTIKSSEYVILAYIVGTLTNIATNHQLGRLPGFIAFVICTFVLLLLAELIYNSLRAGEVRSINIFLRRRILQGMLGRPGNENRESLGFLTNDFKLLETNRIDAEFDAILAVSTLTLALSYALYSNWILTVVFFAGSMIPVLASNLFQKPIQSASEKWTEANASYVGQVKNFIDASDCVRLYDRAEQVACKNEPGIRHLEEALRRMNLLNNNANSCINVIANIGTFVLPFLLGIYLVLRGQTTLGALFSIVQLSNAFVNPILILLQERNNFSTTRPIVEKVSQFLKDAEKKNPDGLAMHDELSLDGISVSRNGRNLLENIRIDIIRGKKIAVTGPSGSGKSTLMKLLVSDDESIGRIDDIILDGKPVDAADISSLFAYSSQYPVVLADTLWFNLTLGRKIGKQRVMDVCKSLDLDDIVREKGFDYVLSADGTGLSGGQLARIELARAVLSERPILLLDEINASLDSRTDMDIHHYLWNSNLTFIEIIHHYKKEDLKNYDAVIDVSDYS